MLNDNSLHAFYDLRVSPLSFDFVCFLVEAERSRRELTLDQLNIVIVPEHEQENLGTKLIDTQQEKWRMANLISPACWLLPSCTTLTICADRDHAEEIQSNISKNVFPKNYLAKAPVSHHHTGLPVLAAHQGHNLQYLESSSQSRSYVQKWLEQRTGGKKVITLTLREATFTPKRNSNFKIWAGIAHKLEEKGFYPIVVRDTDKALNVLPPELEGIQVFSIAAFNLEMRMALYEESHICAFVSNGPSTPCYFSRNVKYVYFVTGEWLDQKNSTFNRVGIEWGSTPPFTNEFQRWVWKEQDIETYLEEIISLDQHICMKYEANKKKSMFAPLAKHKRNGYEIASTMLKWCRGQHYARPEAEIALEAIKTLGRGDRSKADSLRLKARLNQHIPDRTSTIELYTRVAEISNSELDYLDLVEAMDIGINNTEMTQYCENLLGRFPNFNKIKEKLDGLIENRLKTFEEDFSVFADTAEKLLSWYDVGGSHEIINDHASAIQETRSHLYLAAIYANQNNHEEAASHFERALSCGCKSRTVMLRLGISYVSIGRLSEAIDIFEAIDLGDIKSVQTTLTLGQLYIKIGNFRKASEIYEKSVIEGYANDEINRRIAELEKLDY